MTKEQVDAIAQQMKAEVDVVSKHYGDKPSPWKDGFRYALAELLRRLPDEPTADPARCTEPNCWNHGLHGDVKCGYHTAENRTTPL